MLLAAVPVTATMLLLLQSRALSGMLSGQRPEFLEADVDQMPILITALDRLERKMIHLEQMSETILVKAPTSSAGSGSSGPSLDPESLARVERRSGRIHIGFSEKNSIRCQVRTLRASNPIGRVSGARNRSVLQAVMGTSGCVAPACFRHPVWCIPSVSAISHSRRGR